MLEPTIPWNEMIRPDINTIAKRDAFLSDENGKKLQEAIDQIHLMEEILDVKECNSMENQCVMCGAIVPEGREVCPNCENRWRLTEKNDARPFDNYCKALGRTPEMEYGRIIQNLTVSAHILDLEKYAHIADMLRNAADSYSLLYRQAYEQKDKED